MEQHGYCSLANVRLEEVAQCVPRLVLEAMDSLVDFAQNLQTGTE